MKNKILIPFLLIGFIGFSQFGRNNNGMNSQRNQQYQTPTMTSSPKEKDVFKESDVHLEAGIIFYDIADVLKESKSKSAQELKSITAILTEYNLAVKKIEQANKAILDATELNIRQKEQHAIETKNVKDLLETQQYVLQKLELIRLQVEAEELIIATKLTEQLTEKTHKRCLKFIEKRKKESLPKNVLFGKSTLTETNHIPQ
jgi:hypothetical protein